MYTESTLKEQCQRILEDNGGKIANKSNKILLKDPALKDLQQPLEFISKNWRDPLTPAMMSLSCEAVGGQPKNTHEAALAMSLLNLSLYIWDDIIDKAPVKQFKPTLFGKYGKSTAIITGGLASAKAFSILNQMNTDNMKRQILTDMFWNLCAKMAKAETANLIERQGNSSSRKKLWIIKTEAAADVETCLRIGATLGNGSEDQIKHLGRYGLYLGIILELMKDCLVSINLTIELTEKIRNRALPYSVLWAREHSEKVRKKLENLTRQSLIKPIDVKEIVENILETKTLTNTTRIIRNFSKKAESELSGLKKKKASRALKFFVKAQPELLIERLSTIK